MEWPSSQVSILFLSKYIGHSRLFPNEKKKKRLMSGLSLYTQLIHKQWMDKCVKTTWSDATVCCSAYTFSPHSISPSLFVIYLSVCCRIDSLLYSRPLMPGGDSPCQAAGSNEKLKEHINSSIWGHEDENSCQRPARNNWSHNAALLYVSEVMGVKQQLKTQGSENTRVLSGYDRHTTLKKLSSSKQAINMSCSKPRLKHCFYLVLSMSLKTIRQDFQ